MQPTAPTLWVWKRLSRTQATNLRAHDRVTSRDRHDLYGYEVYGFRNDYGRSFIMPEPNWLNSRWAAMPSNAPASRFRPDIETWRMPNIQSIQIPSLPKFEPVPLYPVRGSLPGGGMAPAGPINGLDSFAPPPGGASNVTHWTMARGWAAGALLLVLLLWMLKLADSCLQKRLFKSIMRRQNSEEWSTPNVTALSYPMQQLDMDVNRHQRPGDTGDLSDSTQRSGDLPPPYSECADINNMDKYGNEEPPPPYSACYESDSPKDLPEVHIQNRRRQNILDEQAHTSTEMDNVQNDLIENRRRTISTSHEQTDSRVELVLENGRVIERVVDRNSNQIDTDMNCIDTDGDDNRNVTRERVTFVDEVSSNTRQERVLLV